MRTPSISLSLFVISFLNFSTLSLANSASSCRAPIDAATIQNLFRKYVPEGSNGRAPAGAFYHIDENGDLKLDVFSTSQNVRQAVASTQKILTAYMTVKKGNLSSKVKFTALDLDFDNEGHRAIHPATGKEIQVGESVAVSEYMNTLLIQSSNGAAQALSRGIGGTTQKFMQWINQDVPVLLSHYEVLSYFQNPHGLTDDSAHYQFADPSRTQLSTADNMARFIGKIMSKSSFRSALKSIGYPGNGEGVVVKNGFTQAAGSTIIGRFPLVNSGCVGHSLSFAMFGSKADDQFKRFHKVIDGLYAKLYSAKRINPEVRQALDALIQQIE